MMEYAIAFYLITGTVELRPSPHPIHCRVDAALINAARYSTVATSRGSAHLRYLDVPFLKAECVELSDAYEGPCEEAGT